MRKNLFIVAAVALSAVISCNKEGLADNDGIQTPSSVVFTAGVDTKTTLVDNGDKTYSINWNNGDAITVDGVTFTTLSEGAKAYFSTESAFTEDNDYEAIYPATAGTSFASVTVPASQVAVAGNFCSSAAVSVAKSTTTSLDFKNVTSFLKFQVPADATKVTISSSSPLAGEVSVDYNNGEPTWTAKNTVNTLTVTCDGGFKTGVDYYVSVLPGEKTNFEVRLDGYFSKSASAVTAKRSTVMNMKTLPAPERFTWGLVGAHQSGSGWDISNPTPMYKVDQNVYAALNQTLKSPGFKFVMMDGKADWNKKTTQFGGWRKSGDNDFFNFDTEMSPGSWYGNPLYSDKADYDQENIGVSDFAKKYDIYVRVYNTWTYQDGGYGVGVKYTVVEAGTKVTYPN